MKIGILSLLGLIFTTLKLTGVITWSWGWVLLPFYGPLALYLIIVLGIFILAVIGAYSK